jgi:hypothetical protein
MENYHHQDNGDVQAATCQRKAYQRTILAGVRKRQIPAPSLDCPLILVASPVLDPANALTPAVRPAMLALASHVIIWDRLLLVSVVKKPPLEGV